MHEGGVERKGERRGTSKQQSNSECESRPQMMMAAPADLSPVHFFHYYFLQCMLYGLFVHCCHFAQFTLPPNS
jgi:hypothetical protein